MPVELTDASIRVQQAGTPITIRFVGNGDTYTVPSGKRLLIQYINWNNFGCQIAVWNAGAVDFGGNPAHRFSFEDASGIGEPVTIHAGGGQIVRMTPGGQSSSPATCSTDEVSRRRASRPAAARAEFNTRRA